MLSGRGGSLSRLCDVEVCDAGLWAGELPEDCQPRRVQCYSGLHVGSGCRQRQAGLSLQVNGSVI